MSSEHYQAQEDLSQTQAEQDMAMQEVSRAAADQAFLGRDRGLLEQIGDADIDAPQTADEGDIVEVLSAELSHHNALGNISREEYENRKLLHQVLAMQVKAEYPRKSGVSSKCSGRYRRELLGSGEADKKQLPDDLARKIDSTLGEEGVKSQMTSLSIGAKAFDGVTTNKAYASITGADSDGGDGGGMIQTAKSFLGFGGAEE